MKLPSPRNHLDVALLIFSAMRAVGVSGLQLRTSKTLGSPSRYVFVGKEMGVRVSNHRRREIDDRIELDLVGHHIPTITKSAIQWLEENYGIKIQTAG